LPISTNLSVQPYSDDYDPAKNYYKILFRPSVAVQVRELNQLQTMFQAQIERFGDNIFKRGTIVDGCNFSFLNNYAYVKLVDNDVNGVPIDVSLFNNLFVKNADGLAGYVVNYVDGFEAAPPDLKTIYVNYINSGISGTDTAFSPADTLTVYDSNNSIFSVSVENGGLNFSNTDELIFSPALVVSMTTGNFSTSQYIIDPDTGANVQIISIDTTTLADSSQVILYVSPRATDLADGDANSDFWTINKGADIINAANTASATVLRVIGTGAKGEIITNAVGKVKEVIMTDRGSGYTYIPSVRIQSANNTSGIAILDLVAQNYLTKVKVASGGDATGTGYAFLVSNGVIYQKGYFERVDKQVVIVDKYSNAPNSVAVGFKTLENIIDANIDTSLLDNSLGIDDSNAPGANRLQLVPTLTVLDLETAKNTDGFFTLVEWNDGNPYKQNQVSSYSRIGDEMAQRTFDSSGNFVLDPFLVTTASPSNSALEGNSYSVVVDSGNAYIKGKHVKTNFNYRIDVGKGLDTAIANTLKVSLNYDAYVRINQVGGIFQFSTADQISLYDTAKTYLSNVSLVVASNTTPQGNLIGTARIRSMVLEQGTPGDPTAIYRLYLFNVNVANGSNFNKVRSVYYNGSSYKGIGDIILDRDPTTSANLAHIQSVENDAMVFRSGLESIKNSNNTTYIYRTIDQTTTTGNNGILTKSIAASPDEFFPYSGDLSNDNLKDLYVVPIGNNLVEYDSLTGTVSCNTTSPNVTGTSTTFLSDLVSGDYIYLFPNNDIYDIKKVITVVNNTLIVVDSNCVYANTTNQFKRTFPKNLPVPFGVRAGLSGNVDANGNILTLDFGMTFDTATSVNTALGVNIMKMGATSAAKTVNRNQLVKLQLSNNVANTVGPWVLGVSDVFRLRNVWVGDSSVNTASIDITSEFYIDSNHNANFADLSYLFLQPKSGLALISTDYLLVSFDYYTTSSASYHDTVSYLHTANAAQIATLDSLPLANLSSDAATWEIPEIYTYKGKYYDLMNCIDFRPSVVATASPTQNAATAPVNPVYTLSFGNTADPTNDKKFPLPDSLFQSDVQQYLGRKDDIVIGSDGNIVVVKGLPNADPAKRYEPNLPVDILKLQTLDIPPYPNLPKNQSFELAEVVSTGVFNERDLNTRIENHSLGQSISIQNVRFFQPQGYNMAQIGNLERRIQSLEYYTSLSILETSITNKTIPSSIDGSINRFKYGFFADDFSTKIYSDTSNPQYAADIETVQASQNERTEATGNTLPSLASNLLVPPGFHWSLKHFTGQFSAAYVNFVCVDQNNATDIKIVDVGNTAQIYEFWYDFGVLQTDGVVPGVASYVNEFTFSTKPGIGHLYFDFSNDPLLQVFQNNVLLIDTGSSLPLTNAEVVALMNDPYSGPYWEDMFAGTYFPNGQIATLTNNPLVYYADGFVIGVGKLTFNHNPINGTNYKIKLTMGGFGHAGVLYMMEYPADVTLNAGQLIEPGGVNSLTNWGTMQISTFLNGTPPPTSSSLSYDYIKMTCTGLRPNTKHSFYVDGVIEVDNVRPFGGNLGDPLISGADGTLVACYHLTEVWFTRVANVKIETLVREKNKYSPNYFNQQNKNYIPVYALFELAAVGSLAYAEVPLVMPNKLIF